MNLRPLGDRVWIKPEDAPDHTASGLHLVEHRKPEQTGTVAQIGDKVTIVQVGEFVIFPWAVGYEVFVDDGDRYLMMREGDILAVVEPEEVSA